MREAQPVTCAQRQECQLASFGQITSALQAAISASVKRQATLAELCQGGFLISLHDLKR